ncbi:MAG: hypothetical protein H0U82_02730 [Actinobacteria bacterium]|nr:hypothetical protein [Actinomycetota bacterium]
MSSAALSRIHRGLIATLVSIYLVAGLAGPFVDVDNKILWIAFLCGGAALILVGAMVRALPPRLSAVLIAIGAIAGGIALLWTILVPLAAAVLVALSFSLSRRPQAA